MTNEQKIKCHNLGQKIIKETENLTDEEVIILFSSLVGTKFTVIDKENIEVFLSSLFKVIDLVLEKRCINKEEVRA